MDLEWFCHSLSLSCMTPTLCFLEQNPSKFLFGIFLFPPPPTSLWMVLERRRGGWKYGIFLEISYATPPPPLKFQIQSGPDIRNNDISETEKKTCMCSAISIPNIAHPTSNTLDPLKNLLEPWKKNNGWILSMKLLVVFHRDLYYSAFFHSPLYLIG